FLTEAATDPGRLKIAFTRRTGSAAVVDADCRQAVTEAAKLLASLGHDVAEADPGVDGEAAWATFVTLVSANMRVVLGAHPDKRYPNPDEIEKVTYATAKLGEAVTGETYVRATQAAHKLGRDMARFHESYDVLITPGLATPPVKLGWLDMMMDDVREYWRRI